MQVTIINNLNLFLKLHSGNKKSFLDQCAKDGVNYIREETPVDTGALKEANSSEVIGDSVQFSNDKEYAPMVELGTFLTYANPFMKRGINRLQSDLPRLLKELSV